VSFGLKEVWIEAIDDAGETAERNLERSRLRYLRGIGLGIEGQEKGIVVGVNAEGELEVKAFDSDMALRIKGGFSNKYNSDGICETDSAVQQRQMGR